MTEASKERWADSERADQPGIAANSNGGDHRGHRSGVESSADFIQPVAEPPIMPEWNPGTPGFLARFLMKIAGVFAAALIGTMTVPHLAAAQNEATVKTRCVLGPVTFAGATREAFQESLNVMARELERRLVEIETAKTDLELLAPTPDELAVAGAMFERLMKEIDALQAQIKSTSSASATCSPN